jgi:hypothetical protein
MIINMQVILPVEDGDKLDLIILILILFRGDANKLINIISEAKLIKTFDDKDRLIVDKFVLFKNDTDKGIVIANKDLYATEVIDIGED